MCSIKAKGLEMVEVDSFDAVVPEDKIGYVFSGSELNISSWVFYAKVAGGAFSGPDWTNPEENPEAYRGECEIIYQTQKVPRMLVIVRDGLDEKLVGRIKEELLKVTDKTQEGKEALGVYKLNGFFELPRGEEGVLKPIRDLLEAAGEEVH